MIHSWVTTWNERILNWIEEGPDFDMGLKLLREAYNGAGDSALQLNAMPEPFVGDPLSTEAPTAVMLTLNPGEAGAAQLHGCGELVQRVESETYSEVAKSYLHENTKKWWSGRSRWPARILGISADTCRVVGIDMIPWHSKKWGGLQITSETRQWFKENVLQPASHLAAGSALSRISKPGYPLVLAIGSQHVHLLQALDFSLIEEVNDRTGMPHWPILNDRPVKRSIRLFMSDDPFLAVLQTDAPGGFLPPGTDFDPIVRTLLEQWRNTSK